MTGYDIPRSQAARDGAPVGQSQRRAGSVGHVDAARRVSAVVVDQRPTHAEPDQRAMIQKSVQVICEYTGKPVVGWLGPGLTETPDTPDLLAEAGIRSIADW